MKKTFYLWAVALLSMMGVRAQKPEIFTTDGKAIKGYDAVAFFKESKPVKGSDSLSCKWKGAVWMFSTQADLDSFKANPEKFSPQYGGYCAYGTSLGHKAPTETDTWTILHDKLYFNYNTKVKEVWMKDQQVNIAKADDQWPGLKDK